MVQEREISILVDVIYSALNFASLILYLVPQIVIDSIIPSEYLEILHILVLIFKPYIFFFFFISVHRKSGQTEKINITQP